MSETSNGTCSGSIGGDSDCSGHTENRKVCRDFIRNVCQRPQCRFVHPENINVRTDPIFCHDFQQGKCYRVNCKFIHCTKDDEDHFRKTGSLPEGVTDPEDKMSRSRNGGGTLPRGNRTKASARVERVVDSEVPICKDFLKGVCERGPRGCRYRHVHPRGPPTSPTYGRPVMVRGRDGVRMMMAPVVVTARRKGLHGGGSELYDDGPEPKRFHHIEEYYEEEYEIDMVPPPPPPRGMLVPHNQGYYHHQHQHFGGGGGNQGYAAMSNGAPPRNGVIPVAHHRNHHNHNQPDQFPYFQSPMAAAQADTIKSLEDENFMLKRRIEELKSSNEFLLSQNAQLRLSNTLTVGTSAQVPLSVSAVAVSASGPSSQPSIIGITSSSIGGTQTLPTISISTLPTVNVTPVSISQTSISQPQLYLSAPAINQ